MHARHQAAFTALLAAALFGATTPLAKTLLGSVSPFMVAGLFYLGSGLGLAVLIAIRHAFRTSRERSNESRIPRGELPWLLGAITAGGIAAPALLMFGLSTTGAAATSLLLNLEAVFTAVIAWVVFRENVDSQIFLGMTVIVIGGAVLSWQPGPAAVSTGAMLVAAACAAWAIDNNLTRKVSTNDAMTIACLKGLIAGSVNLGIAITAGAHLPGPLALSGAMLTGFAGYGISLVLFVVSLRNLGSARTGAYFSVAPLFGVALSLILWPAWPSSHFWMAAALMAVGIWLHVREKHEHTHTHEPQAHNHRHSHDEHHQHVHDFDWDGVEPHTHPHEHTPLTHSHRHFPDIHHRHGH